jgi:tRNA threonylcarbamoyladenosine biosynthesis protein TsaE
MGASHRASASAASAQPEPRSASVSARTKRSMRPESIPFAPDVPSVYEEHVSAALELALPNRRATRRLGAALADSLHAGDLLVLEGDLGAGKTFLVRAIARGLGVPAQKAVTSPTFTLVNEYAARLPLLHADLYRLGDADELVELGLLDRIGRDAVAIVEWGDRFAHALGDEGLWLWLAYAEPGRRARLEARGARGQALLARVADRMVAPPAIG